MFALLGVCVCAGVVFVLGWKLLGLAERRLRLQERYANTSQASQPAPMPADLVRMASGEGATWARADKLQWMRELYNETGSWDTVRGIITGADVTH